MDLLRYIKANDLELFFYEYYRYISFLEDTFHYDYYDVHTL